MKKRSWSASVRMLVGAGLLLCTMAVHAATEAETRALLGTLQLEKVLREALREVNSYQLEKRLKAMQPPGPQSETLSEKQAARLKAFALTLERVLAWPKVEPLVVESVSKGLSSEEVAALGTFLSTPAGRIYIEDYQYMPAPVANAVDAFVDKLVDQALDEPNRSLVLVGPLTAQEKAVAQVLQKLQSPQDRSGFEVRRERFLAEMGKLVKSQYTGEDAQAQRERRMQELGRAYSLEQMNWRAAQVVSARMAPERVKTLSAALDDAATATLLQKLGEASQGAGGAISQHLQKDPAFVDMLRMVLKPGE